MPTNPIGILSVSGTRYLVDDIREYGIQLLLLCSLSLPKARHFVEWVLGIDSDNDDDFKESCDLQAD
jgi:hypothetical protein